MLHRYLSDLMVLPVGPTCQDTDVTMEDTSTPSDLSYLALSTVIDRTPEAVRHLPSHVSVQDASQDRGGVAPEEQSTNDRELSSTLKSIQDIEPTHIIIFRDQINGAEDESVSIHDSKKLSDSECDVSNVIENDSPMKIIQVTSGENVEDCAGTDSTGHQNKDSVQSLTTFCAELDIDVVGNEVEIETIIPAHEDCLDEQLHFDLTKKECDQLCYKNMTKTAEERLLPNYKTEEDMDSECENISVGTEDRYSELVNISSGTEGNRSFELDHVSVGEVEARDSSLNMDTSEYDTVTCGKIDSSRAATDAITEEYRHSSLAAIKTRREVYRDLLAAINTRRENYRDLLVAINAITEKYRDSLTTNALQTKKIEDSNKQPRDILNSTSSNHLGTSTLNQREEKPVACEDAVEVNRYLTTPITDYLPSLEAYPGDEHRFPCFCKHTCRGKIAPQYKKHNRILMWKSSNSLIDCEDFKARKKTARF